MKATENLSAHATALQDATSVTTDLSCARTVKHSKALLRKSK